MGPYWSGEYFDDRGRFRDKEEWRVSELDNFCEIRCPLGQCFVSYRFHPIRGGAVHLSYASVAIFVSRLGVMQRLIGPTLRRLNVGTRGFDFSLEMRLPVTVAYRNQHDSHRNAKCGHHIIWPRETCPLQIATGHYRGR